MQIKKPRPIMAIGPRQLKGVVCSHVLCKQPKGTDSSITLILNLSSRIDNLLSFI